MEIVLEDVEFENIIGFPIEKQVENVRQSPNVNDEQQAANDESGTISGKTNMKEVSKLVCHPNIKTGSSCNDRLAGKADKADTNIEQDDTLGYNSELDSRYSSSNSSESDLVTSDQGNNQELTEERGRKRRRKKQIDE